MTDQEIIDYIRLRLGNISCEELPDAVIFAFLSVRKAQYPTDQPLQIFYTICDCVEYLIASNTNQGDPTRVLQQEGQVIVDVSGISHVESWRTWLNRFKNNPNIDGLTSPAFGNVKVGGVSKKESCRVRNNPDSLNSGYRVNGFFDE